MIFRDSTGVHLGISRILIFSILLIDLCVDDLPALADMPLGAFLPRGALTLLPPDFYSWLLREEPLQVFSILYGLLLIFGLTGIGPSWLVTGLALIGTTLFQGIARGFGGHVNHQELIVLHAMFFLLFPQAYSSVSLNALLSPKPMSQAQNDISRFLLRSLSFWILLTYFFIGVARLQTSDWRVYGTNAMVFYALLHSTKWNYWHFSWAKDILQQAWLSWFLAISFPLATILELAAPLALFFSRCTLPIVCSLLLFHTMILLFMNIFFWQNMLLLLIPAMGWLVDRKVSVVAR